MTTQIAWNLTQTKPPGLKTSVTSGTYMNRIFILNYTQVILDSFVLGVPKYFGEGFLQCASGDAMTRRLLFSVE